MAAGHAVRNYLNESVNVPASQTNYVVTQQQGIQINQEMRTNLKVDVLIGKVVAAGTPTVALQDSTGLGFWNTVATSSSISASTDKTISAVNVNTGVLTSASHGYTAGQLVVINSTGTPPGGIIPGRKHFIANPTTNTFQLYTQQGNAAPIQSFSDAGSGTITATAVTSLTLKLNVEVAGDQAVMPLRPTARLVSTTGAGDTVQVVDVRACHIY